MADNVTFERNAKSTPPNQTVVATDDVSGRHMQVVKIDIGGDGLSVPLVADGTTNALRTVDYNHHEIHAGSHFFVIDAASLAINNVFDMTFLTANSTKWSHWTFNLDVTGETEWFVYEGATATNPLANAVTPRNNDRNNTTSTSGNTLKSELQATIAAANADTSVVGATEIMHGILGAGRNGGNWSRGEEIILKANTLYCMRAVANAATIVAFKMEWYEHQNL